jgi:hypothetical protein
MSWLTPRPRMISQLSSSLEKRLNFYALAASTAGLSVLTLAQPAEAKIVYTKTHQLIGLHHPYKLDLNHDGTVDFLIQETQAGSMGFKVNELATKEPKGNAVVGYPNYSRRYASALKKGVAIGGRQSFVSQGHFGQEMAVVQQSDSVFYKYYGPWTNVTNGYLGLKFKIHAETHYGWARLTVVHNGFKLTAMLTGFAYETIAGKSIKAGQEKGVADEDFGSDVSLTSPISDTPEPVTLGALAMGSPGLSIWRREESLDATE